jgi:hypothetical protein
MGNQDVAPGAQPRPPAGESNARLSPSPTPS